jgi:UDP-N-acetylglucosamine/UDP-N-acetylgalactosamine 4-epimerase
MDPMYAWVQESLRASPRSWLVTGAAGFIGSNLLESLLKLDQHVAGLDNLSTGSRDNLAMVRDAVSPQQWARFRFVEGDIGDLRACREGCRRAQLVLHQAALCSVPRSIEDPIEAHRSNVTGFLHMLAAAREAGVSRFVYAGSSAAYGDDPREQKIEPQTGHPLSPYALGKYVDELYADLHARCYGLACIGLRYFNVFGPRQDPDGAYASVIPGWIARMLRGETVHINGDGHTTRDFCYVDNVVQANLLAALVDNPGALNQVYNVALGRKTTLNELFASILALLVSRFPQLRALRPVYRDFRAGDVRHSQADIGKARELLGYQPSCTVEQGLAKAIDWYVAKLAPPEARGAERLAATL